MTNVRIAKNKKGQIAIGVIVAIVIALAILAVFFIGRKPGFSQVEQENPAGIIQSCAIDSVNEAVDKMLLQGGFVEPDNYKVYNNQKISYLCQNKGYFKPCINQHPLLLTEMRDEIKDYTEPRLEECFRIMKSEFEKRQYKVEMEPMKLNVSFGSGKIYLDIERKIILTKNEQTQKFEKIDIEVNSPLYDLGKIAIETANQEAKYCYFEYIGYMILYPRFDIRKFAMSDSTKIYTIKDRYSNKEMNIAIRGCSIPPGI